MTSTSTSTTGGNGTTATVITPPPEQRAVVDSRRARTGLSRLLVMSIVLMLAGSLLASWLNSAAGTAAVKDIKIFGTNGYITSAYLYTPAGVTAQKAAPGIVVFHGLNNQKDYMSNTALEFARRGFVVLSADMTGHGYSNGANGENGFGGPDALRYIRTLPIVDKNNIGLIGMSQGGFGPVTAAAQAVPDGYKSIFYMESECTAPGVPNLQSCQGLKNVAFNIGTATELGVMVLVPKGSDAPNSPVVKPVFGTSDPIKVGQLYGSIADGTARILYQPYETHPESTDSPVAIANAIDWMQQTLDGGNNLAPTDQIWPWKVFGTTVALVGAFLFLFAFGGQLLCSRVFAPLSEPVPAFRGFTGMGWWIAALITTALGPLLYLWVWQNVGLGGGFVAPNALWPQNFTNVYMVWAVVVGLIALALIWVNHRFFTARLGGTAVNYGLAWEERGVIWSRVWHSLVLALAIIAPLYVILLLVNSVWMVDFRAWVVALMPMSPVRFQAFLGYLIPFAIFFIPESVIFAGFIRPRSGNVSLAGEMVISSVVLTLGALVWILLAYIPLFAGQAMIFGSDFGTAAAAGLGAIYYIPLLVVWPVVACLYTYYFRKTGHIYTGAFLATLFVVWMLAAFADFAVTP
ncbi:MAG: alpha/beta hydrolase [Chloroflexi bacterium]|nr:alpha/beta hydrolase [Chloroflexota bacterium]